MAVLDLAAARPIDRLVNVDRLRVALVERGVGAAVMSAEPNKLWLTGFAGAGRVVVTADRIVIVTDPRYGDRAVADLDDAGLDAEVVVCGTQRDATDQVVSICAGVETVGAEGDRLTYDDYCALQSRLPLTSISGVTEGLRRRKQDGEVDRMRIAAQCAAAALAEVAPNMLGRTEREIAAELDHLMRSGGADGSAYDTIVAAGPKQAARPHHHPNRRVVVTGDTVIIDVGASVDGYRSDMTRSFVLGEPSAEQERRYRAVVEAQAAGREATRAGATAVDVDAACRTRLAHDGLDQMLIHGVGHGVGLEIHEPPLVGKTSNDVLQLWDVITIEPGIYDEGFGGFRVEDLGVVGDDGYEVLTVAPYDLAP